MSSFLIFLSEEKNSLWPTMKLTVFFTSKAYERWQIFMRRIPAGGWLRGDKTYEYFKQFRKRIVVLLIRSRRDDDENSPSSIVHSRYVIFGLLGYAKTVINVRRRKNEIKCMKNPYSTSTTFINTEFRIFVFFCFYANHAHKTKQKLRVYMYNELCTHISHCAYFFNVARKI